MSESGNTSSELTLPDILERLMLGFDVKVATPDKGTSERVRLAVVGYKGKAERFNKQLGITTQVLQADFDIELGITTLRLADKRRSKPASLTFTVLHNPQLDG